MGFLPCRALLPASTFLSVSPRKIIKMRARTLIRYDFYMGENVRSETPLKLYKVMVIMDPHEQSGCEEQKLMRHDF